MVKSLFLSMLLAAAIALSGAFSGVEKTDQAIACKMTDDASPATKIVAVSESDLEADFYTKTQEDWTKLDPADYEIVSSNKDILLPERGEDGEVLLHFLSEGQTKLTVVNGDNIKTLPVLSRPPIVAFYSGNEISADSRLTEFVFDETNRAVYVLLDTEGGYMLSEWYVSEGNELVDMDNTNFESGIIKLIVLDHVNWAFNLTFNVKASGNNGLKTAVCTLQCKPA